jgi:hypothetical protein
VRQDVGGVEEAVSIAAEVDERGADRGLDVRDEPAIDVP